MDDSISGTIRIEEPTRPGAGAVKEPDEHLHPLSPGAHGHGGVGGMGRRSVSYTSQKGYFDAVTASHASSSQGRKHGEGYAGHGHAQGQGGGNGRRNHAASISSFRSMAGNTGRATQADLLGVGVRAGRPRSMVGIASEMAQGGRRSRSGSAGGEEQMSSASCSRRGSGSGSRARSRGETTLTPADLDHETPIKTIRPDIEIVDNQRSHSHDIVNDIATDFRTPTRPPRSSPREGREMWEYVDSLSKEDAAVLEMRFDLMSDEELGIYLETLFPLPGPTPGLGREIADTSPLETPRGVVGEVRGGERAGGWIGPGSVRREVSVEQQKMGVEGITDRAEPEPSQAQAPGSEQEQQTHETKPTPLTPRPILHKRLRSQRQFLFDDKSPLFPPSPPGGHHNISKADHPLRVLSRAVRELQESVRSLQSENERLQQEVEVGRAVKGKGKGVDEASIHDGLTEALSTSLASPSILPRDNHAPFDQPLDYTSSIYTPSARRQSPASSISVPFPSSPTPPHSPATHTGFSKGYNGLSVPTPKRNGADQVSLSDKQASRSSWTAGLWVWNKKAKRKGSVGSLASLASATPQETIKEGAGEIVEEADAEWRKGDGESPPSFKAIFLATRIITPDPSSILVSHSTAPNSLIAYLAHALINNARDEGISIRETVRRNSRSRAASIASTETPYKTPDTPLKEGYSGYGDQALAMGKSLLSSVSSATLRGAKLTSQSDDPSHSYPYHTAHTTHRPSLLSRVSSSRPFPTTAVSPPTLDHNAASSATSPSEEIPPPSVELASIVPDESRPPTVLLSRQNLGNFFLSNRAAGAGRGLISTATRFKGGQPPLTDRYGFIYDIQHARMLKDASVAGTPAPASLNGTLPTIQHPERDDAEGWIDKRKRQDRSHPHLDSPRPSIDSTRSTSKESINTLGSLPPAKTPDSSHTTPPLSRTNSIVAANTGHNTLTRHRSPSAVTGLNPSPVRAVTGKDHLTVSARGASSLITNISTSSSSSPISASLAKLPNETSVGADAKASRATISSLLDQLTEIHDRQQDERKSEWDTFLRKRQKALAAANSGGAGGKKGKKDRTRRGSAGSEVVGIGIIGVGQMGRSGKEEERKMFGRLVRGGIPLAYRSDIWAECSGAKDLMVPGEYAEILKKHANEDSPVLKDVEKDVGRTFPGNVFFGGDGPGVAKLRRVLIAYSWHNPSVGYCQGMNMLAATLLLTHTDEEQAYWTLLAIIERFLPSTFFSPTLLASRADQAVLFDLVRIHLPKIHDKLADMSVDLASITFGWFLSLFTDCLPVETLFRVWDVFFVEGRDSLFRVALAILKLNESDVLASESVGDLFGFIGGMTSRLWAADKLIALQHSYKSVIRHNDIETKFQRHLKELQEAEAG